jgi:acetolactate synthase-1/2/3 large subunit
MRVADYIVQFLSKHVDRVYTVCGGGSIFLNDALGRTLPYTACHHEQAAAMAAEGYARARNGLGAVFVTSGPGGTNAITGVLGAWTDHAPMIVISGQSFLSQTIGDTGVRTLGVQEINIIDIVRPITKFAQMVKDPEEVPGLLSLAIHYATTGRPGPVWLDIPACIQNSQISDWGPEYRIEQMPSVVDVSEAVALLKSAKRPLVHIGQGIRIANAIPELFKFLEAAKIPVLTARNGNDLIASDHPLYIGRPGTFAQRGANFAVQSCDVYLAIGTRLGLAQTGYNAKDYARNAKIIQVDIDSAELCKDTVPIAVKVQADAKDFLKAMPSEWPDWSGWLAHCKRLQAKYPPVTQEMRKGGMSNSYALIERVSQLAGYNDVIVTDVGYAYQNTNQVWAVKGGQRLITNGGTAAMGWGLPAAIGAAQATGRRVILFVGDGGLMFNIQELATLAHHKLNIKIFVLDNDGYLTMRKSQDPFGSYMGSDSKDLTFPNFECIADAHGIVYEAIEREHPRNIAAFLRMVGPVMCHVILDADQEQIPKAINRRIEGKLVPTAIEDAYPFLDPAEVAENLRAA